MICRVSRSSGRPLYEPKAVSVVSYFNVTSLVALKRYVSIGANTQRFV